MSRFRVRCYKGMEKFRVESQPEGTGEGTGWESLGASTSKDLNYIVFKRV